MKQKNMTAALLMNRGFDWQDGTTMRKVRRTGAVTTVEFFLSDTALTMVRNVRTTSGKSMLFNTFTVMSKDKDTLWDKCGDFFAH